MDPLRRPVIAKRRALASLFAGLALLAGACDPDDPAATEDTTDGPAAPVITPALLQVDCVAGDSFRAIGQLGAPGHYYAIPGISGVADRVVVSRDDGRSWDLVPLVAEAEGLVVVKDALVVRGRPAPPAAEGLYLVAADLSLHLLAFDSDGSGNLPPDSWVAKPLPGLWVGRTAEGWYRWSDDGGQTWRSSRRAFPGGTSIRRIAQNAATLGERALIQSAIPVQIGHEDEVIQYTVDGGKTWAGLPGSGVAATTRPLDQILFGLTGDGGIVLVAGYAQDQTLLMSPDHGASWTATPMKDTYQMAFGPGPGELWSMQNSRVVLHTDDTGQSWSAYTLMAGDVELLPASFRGVVQDSAGRTVFHMRGSDGTTVIGTRTCTVVDGTGQDRVPVPTRDDTPGQIAFWSAGGAVPTREPGGIANPPLDTAQTAGRGFTGEVLHVDRDAEGDLYQLLWPADGVDRDNGPPMEVWEFDGADPSVVKRRLAFNNLREQRGGVASNTFPYYLEARFFQVLPDGTIRIQATDAQGNFELTADPGRLRGFGGIRGRWGDAEGGYAYVTADAAGRSDYSGVLSRMRDPQDTGCLVDDEGEPDCYFLRDGGVEDIAVHGGDVWVLDDLHGVLWRHDIDGSVGDWQRVVTGLVAPSELWSTMDPTDPGIFVRDQGAWWRVVPGDAPIRRLR